MVTYVSTRYFVLLLKSKDECKFVKRRIYEFLDSSLKLKLNRKTRYFPNVCGVSFCGYRVYSSHILVSGSNKSKMKKKINKWNKLYLDGNLDFDKVRNSFNSWLGHISHVNGYNLKKEMTDRMLFKKEMEERYEKGKGY